MRERIAASYHWRWLARAFRGMFTTWGGFGSVVFALGVPLVVAWWQRVTWDEIGPFVVVTGLFLAAAFFLQLILAPRQMERELAAEVGLARVAAAPLDVIRLLDKHIENGRPVMRHLVTMRRAKPMPEDAEFLAASYATRDWMNEALSLVTDHCISRKQDFMPVWRSVPSVVRYGRVNDVTAASLARRGVAEGWIRDGSAVLRGCIELMEKRIGG